MSDKIESFERLLEHFQQLPKSKSRPNTFMEITRFPRSELACSNVLAFFLDPRNEEHGFGDLVLKSLLETAGSEHATGRFRTVEVRREDRTDSNKSLDLVIVSDSFVVGIENKIDAGAYNPFAEYNKRLEKIADENKIPRKNIVRILLALRLLENGFGFKPVTYEEFFSVLQRHLGSSIWQADTRWMIFLLDFINTIQNMKEGHMPKELLEFFRENETAAHNFWSKAVPKVILELKSRAEPVTNLILKWGLPKGISNLKERDDSAWSERNHFAYCIWCEASLGNSHKLGLEAQIRLSGWRILAWPVKDEDVAAAQRFIDTSGFNFKKSDEFKNTWQYRGIKFPFDEEPAVVANKFCQLLKDVSTKISKNEPA